MANIFGVKFLISSILKNLLVEIEVLGPNLHISAKESTIEGCAGSPYHDHQNCYLCLSVTVLLLAGVSKGAPAIKCQNYTQLVSPADGLKKKMEVSTNNAQDYCRTLY